MRERQTHGTQTQRLLRGSQGWGTSQRYWSSCGLGEGVEGRRGEGGRRSLLYCTAFVAQLVEHSISRWKQDSSYRHTNSVHGTDNAQGFLQQVHTITVPTYNATAQPTLCLPQYAVGCTVAQTHQPGSNITRSHSRLAPLPGFTLRVLLKPKECPCCVYPL